VSDIQLAVDHRLGPHIAYRIASLGYAAVRIAHRCQGECSSELVEAANATPDLAFAYGRRAARHLRRSRDYDCAALAPCISLNAPKRVDAC